MRHANLNLLPTLKALLETRSVSRAAELLHLSQPSISKQLAQLRLEFADELLVREGQRWLLTPRAELLLQSLSRTLEVLDELYAPVHFDPANCQRVFRLASSDYVAQYILPEIGAALAQAAPHAALEYNLWHKEQLPLLHSLELDLVSTLTETLPAQLNSQCQGEDGLAVLMRRDHPLAHGTLSLEHYLAASHLQVSGGGDKESPIEQALAPLGHSRRWFARVPFFQAAVELLKRTDCLLTTPSHIAWQLAQDHPLMLSPLPFACARQHYQLIWHQRYQQDPAHRWFRELVFPFLSGHLQQATQAAEHYLATLSSDQGIPITNGDDSLISFLE